MRQLPIALPVVSANEWLRLPWILDFGSFCATTVCVMRLFP